MGANKFWRSPSGAWLLSSPTAPTEDAIECPTAPLDARQVWDGVAGDWGPVPPSYPDLTPRQFWLAALSAGITEAQVDAVIDALPEPDRSQAQISKRFAITYVHDDPLMTQLVPAMGLTQEGFDSLWLVGVEIP